MEKGKEGRGRWGVEVGVANMGFGKDELEK